MCIFWKYSSYDIFNLSYVTVEYGCGSTTSENCSYFVSSSSVNAGQCRLRVCPCSDDICQMRLDFDTFIVNQPDTCKLKIYFNKMFYLILPSILSLIFVYTVLPRIEKSLFLLHYTVTPVAYSLYVTVMYKLYITGVTVYCSKNSDFSIRCSTI